MPTGFETFQSENIDLLSFKLQTIWKALYKRGAPIDQIISQGLIFPATWPNVGVGRLNLDGSKGSYTSCHTRHRFSVMEARKPQACG